MADPLRRTLLAKLRGKRSKKAAAGSRAGAEDALPLRPELRFAAGAMRGKQGCGCGGSERRFEPCVRAHACPPEPEARSAPELPAACRWRQTEGDSIGFGSCTGGPFTCTDGGPGHGPGTEPVFNTSLTVGFREDLQHYVHSGEPPAPLFQYLHPELDLIQTFESSLRLSGDLVVPVLQSPTFFPTELQIIDAELSPRLVCSREASNRHNSVDSEDDDYYDNEILPFYESQDRPKASGSLQDPSAQETDRLQSRLKEAYYLLINTMDGITFEETPQENGSGRSQDSLSLGSQSLARHSGSSEEHPCAPEEPNGEPRKTRSLQNLSATQRMPNLRRSMSDRAVRYSAQKQEIPGFTYQVIDGDPDQVGTTSTELGAINESRVSEIPEEEVCPVMNNVESLDGILPEKEELVGILRPIPAKPPGVTVNKMQEWMHKGRLLSSEMRQRIAGSSSHGAETRPRTLNHVQAANGSKAGNQAGGPQLRTGTMAVSVVDNQDIGARTALINSITVSKKRNWLNQSSLRPSATSDEDDLTSPPHHTPASELTEENDADDEGEIWYNPIPEDEEASFHRCEPPSRRQRQTSEGDSGGTTTGAGDSGNVNGGPSSEPVHGFRPVCRSLEEKLSVRITEPLDQGPLGFSPPSSPNPNKKSSSINWSLPERIKSPRTVRKLSMKMKKLPELSRKLSVKGNQTNNQPDSRTPLIKANGPSDLGSGGVSAASTNGNVIWRYHLDSSVGMRQQKKSNELGAPKSAIKGGYLSDGDSPELVAKSGKHGSKSHRKMQEKDSSLATPKLADSASFHPYSYPEQGKCALSPPVSGLLSVHLCGAEGLKTPRNDESRHVYCAIQVDEAKRARTALLPCNGDFLAMDHTFQLELEEAQRLRLVLFGCEATTEPRRQRVCCHGAVALAPLFRPQNGTRVHKLAVRLEPRGVIYVKLGFTERRSLTDANDGEKEREREVFGVEATRVVEREVSGLMVPLIIEKCIAEIERRGCQVVGLYRLCGSAAVKKELREAFERDSYAVELSENNYPDINVITGVLKDYLRELPQPLISKPLYEAVLDAMAKRPLAIGPGGCENDPSDWEYAAGLMESLPDVEKVTLRKLLDHLKRVASHHEVNKMTCQNLAVCFGPVLLSQRQDASGLVNRVFVDSEELASALHFKKHIEVLHYLLQLWPVVDPQSGSSAPVPDPPAPVRRRKERPQVLNLSDAELAGVLRPRAGRLDSPSNRYAGDWSSCKEAYLQQESSEEADYADVPSEEPANPRDEAKDSDGDEEAEVEVDEALDKVDLVQIDVEEKQPSPNEELGFGDTVGAPTPCVCTTKEHTYQAFMKIQEISPVLSHRVNLRDLQESIDALICNLELELNKNKLHVGY